MSGLQAAAPPHEGAAGGGAAADGRIDVAARAMDRMARAKADAGRKREGLPPVEAWADLWHPSSGRQLAALRADAAELLAALDAMPQPAAEPKPRRLPAHDVEILRLCVASAWFHGSISAGRAYELADGLACPRGEMDDLRAEVEREG